MSKKSYSDNDIEYDFLYIDKDYTKRYNIVIFKYERFIMGILNKMCEPVVLKESSSAQEQLQQLEYYQILAPKSVIPLIERDKALIKYGINGEEAIMYELINSHIPMYIIHDLFFEYNGLKAQIDYLLITRKLIIVLESKNLYGNIFVDSSGNFVRKSGSGKTFSQEGIYSPITQNERHLALIKDMRKASLDFISKIAFENNFNKNYKSLVVMANPKTVIDYRYAPRDIKEQIVKVDGLTRKINTLISQSTMFDMSDNQMMGLAQFFLSQHRQNPVDYTAKYQEKINIASKNEEEKSQKEVQKVYYNNYNNTSSGSAISSIKKSSNNGIEESPIYKALRQYRYEKSKAENIKPYIICKNDELVEIINFMPQTPEQLYFIGGFSEDKIKKYGNDIIAILDKYR